MNKRGGRQRWPLLEGQGGHAEGGQAPGFPLGDIRCNGVPLHDKDHGRRINR